MIKLGTAKVHIDDDGIIFDASLNQTNIGGNNNKVGWRRLDGHLDVLIRLLVLPTATSP